MVKVSGRFLLPLPGISSRKTSFCGLKSGPVGLGDGADDAAGNAGGDDLGRDVAGDDAASTDDAAFAYGDAGGDVDTAPDPDVVADFDGFGEAAASDAFLGIEGVVGGVNADAGAEEDVVANVHRCAIQDDAVEIGVEAVAQGDVKTKLAAEVGLEMDAVADAFEELAEEGFALGGWLTEAGIVGRGGEDGALAGLDELGREVIVHGSGEDVLALVFEGHGREGWREFACGTGDGCRGAPFQM